MRFYWGPEDFAKSIECQQDNTITKLMIFRHYDIDRRDGAVQYMRTNAVVVIGGASTDNTVCANQ
jgi:hypothetical protein